MTSTPAPSRIPRPVRIRIAHAAVQAIADDAGVDVLHIKGYAAAAGLYPERRSSTDVDIMVRPSQADALIAALQRHGWRLRTTFRSGSIFEHAAALWHDLWGWADAHRTMPGLTIPAEAAFDRLWARRGTAQIAGLACTVPCRDHQAMLIVVHDARNPGAGALNRDVAHLRRTLGDAELERLGDEAAAFGAELAWAAATGGLDAHRDHPDYPLWAAIRAGAGRAGMLRARIRAARGPIAKARVLLGAAVPNRDHLAMTLGRTPTAADYRRDLAGRIRAALGALGALGRRERADRDEPDARQDPDGREHDGRDRDGREHERPRG